MRYRKKRTQQKCRILAGYTLDFEKEMRYSKNTNFNERINTIKDWKKIKGQEKKTKNAQESKWNTL